MPLAGLLDEGKSFCRFRDVEGDNLRAALGQAAADGLSESRAAPVTTATRSLCDGVDGYLR